MTDPRRNTVFEAMESAALSGLCRDGQLEIGCQAARPLYPELSEAERLAIAEAVYKEMVDGE